MAAEAFPIEATDDFARARIERKEQFLDRFITPYYFGCEADDPLTSGAFRTDENPLGAEILRHVRFGYRPLGCPRPDGGPRGVRRGRAELMSKDNFRSFSLHDNVRHFFQGPNPRFFPGTLVE